jgi:outer membrane protein
MKTKALLIIMIAMLAIPAAADSGDWIVRLRGIEIDPNDSSEQIGDTGSEVGVDSQFTLEIDVTYMLSRSFGLELIAATTRHDLYATGGALNGADLGSVKVLPPTLTLQWYVIPEGMLNFYVGLGVNWTYFYSYDLSEDLADLGVTDINFGNSFGFAGDIGVNVNLGDNWMVNGDIKYILLSTDADIMVGNDTLDRVHVDIDPWVFGLGVGYRF